MATLKMTGSALLTTVQDTAGALSDIVRSTSTSAKMLNDFVEHQRIKQLKNLAVSNVGHEEMLISTRMVEIDKIQDEAAQYIAADPARATRCAVIHQKLVDALAAVKVA